MKEKVMRAVVKSANNKVLAVDWVAEYSINEYKAKIKDIYKDRKVNINIINMNEERTEHSISHVLGWAEGGMRHIYLA